MNAIQKILAAFDITPEAFAAAEVDDVLATALPAPHAKRDAPSSLLLLLRIWDAIRDKAEAGKVEGLAVKVTKAFFTTGGRDCAVTVSLSWDTGFVAACVSGRSDRAKPRVFANGRRMLGSVTGRKVEGLCPIARMIHAI